MIVKIEFLSTIIFDVVYFVLMLKYWEFRKNSDTNDKLYYNVFIYFSYILLGVAGVTFLVVIFLPYFREISLNYIGLKTFYFTLSLIFLGTIFYNFLTTFENYAIFTTNYCLYLGLYITVNIIFLALIIRQVILIRRNAFSRNSEKEEYQVDNANPNLVKLNVSD
jgi:hypothetical protein